MDRKRDFKARGKDDYKKGTSSKGPYDKNAPKKPFDKNAPKEGMNRRQK